MKTLIAIAHQEKDGHVRVLKKALSKVKNLNFIFLCTNNLKYSEISVSLEDEPVIYFKGRKVTNPIFWYVTRPRCDALYADSSQYPNEERLAAEQFITDIDLLFEKKANFYPGNLANISRSESKLCLFLAARCVGLVTPNFTLNGTLAQKDIIKNTEMYRKRLGFPVFISYDRQSSKEVVVELTNDHERNTEKEPGLWQWQEPIESRAQIRCFAHQGKIFSKIWKRNSINSDLVDLRNSSSENITSVRWFDYQLTPSIENKIKKLLKNLNLEFACPEFLIQKDGNLVFVDLNPCGAWLGYFRKPKYKDQIVSLIINSLIS